MKRITFLIGNGFDLNVGLKTRYKDFYEYYSRENPNDFIARSINNNYEYWSDLEIGLGKYTSKIKAGDEEQFWKSEEQLERALADYLRIQTRKVLIDHEGKKKEIAFAMRKSFCGFYNELPNQQKESVRGQIYGIDENIEYSFVSFNYTKIFDLCLKIMKSVYPKNIGTHAVANKGTYRHFAGDILHIHGTTDKEMVLGVNDVEQISNKEFACKKFNRQCLIKAETNKWFEQNKTQEMRNIIDASLIVCVFGMSIGASDKMWWAYLCEWLLGDGNRRLIIYVKDGNCVAKHSLFKKQNEILTRLRKNTPLNEIKWDKIEKQVYVKCNSGMFDFKVI